MTKFKDDLACNIALVFVLALSGIYLILLSLSLFGVTDLNVSSNFSYLTAYVLVIVCLALFICAMIVVNRKKFVVPSWLRILFYIAFFTFTNVYYFWGLFENMFWLCIMFAYISFIAVVCSLSIFYNSLKDEKNRLHISNSFLLLTVTSIALAILFVISLIILVISNLTLATSLLASSTNYIALMLVMFVSSLLTTLSFAVSLKKNKAWINACLVKVDIGSKISRSIKQK